MLTSLHIENIAVIKRLDADFSGGFTVLTGETGAGKSILIDSIAFLLGGKAEKELLRTGETRALVSGFFSELSQDTCTLLEEYGITPEDGSLEIARTLTEDGKTTIKINGRTVSASVGRACCMRLINIHGQHDSQLLQNQINHIGYLDRFAALDNILKEYRQEYAAYKETTANLNRLLSNEQDKERMRDLLAYQINDIESAALFDGEEEQLTARKAVLKNAKQLSKHIVSAYRALYKNSKGTPAVQLMELAQESLNQLSVILPETAPLATRLADLASETESIARQLIAYLPTNTESPEKEIEEIDDRLAIIRKLKRKYGNTIGEILSFLEKAKKSLEEIESSNEKIIQFEDLLQRQKEHLSRLSEALHNARVNAGKQLSERICNVLIYLDMAKVSFFVSVESMLDSNENVFGPNGTDRVEFFISTNIGEPMKPLTKIASGGELSRIMLAIKCVLANAESVASIVFDEVDTGVSGKTSQKIGFKLHELSKFTQVICITHAAQIAAVADTHYLIRKEEIDGRAQSTLYPLDKQGRIEELSRIIGGVNITEKIRASAKELLETSQQR